MGNARVNCLKCKYYAITWNPKFPYACRLLGFKSKNLPSIVAFESTGKACEGFEMKDTNVNSAASDYVADEQGVIVTIGDNEDKHYN